MVTKDYKYEVGNEDDSAPYDTMLITAMEGIDTAQRAGVEVSGAVGLNVHVKLSKNEKEYGIHPRYVVLARVINGSGGNTCLVQKGTILKNLPILTQARFGVITEWTDEDATNAPSTARITLAHKPDGTGTVDYVVLKKVPQRLV